jgi:GxxExxY protein
MVQEQQHEELNRISERIIACVYRVSNTLGAGFLEKVYENALAIELRKNGHKVEQQHLIKVLYNGELVGDFAADLLVDERVLIELKTARVLDGVHSAQCINYLKATGHKLCLLINFSNPRAEIKRIMF